MSWQSGVVLAIALAVPLLAMFLIGFYIPNNAHTIYRHRLWRIRDNLVCDLLSGQISETAQARRLLNYIDTGIRYVPKHTLTDAVLAAILVVRSKTPLHPLEEQLLAEGAEADRVRLLEYLREYQQASIAHLTRGSPSGWLAWLAVNALRVPLARAHKRRPQRERFRDRALHAEVEVLPKLVRHRTTDGSVHAGW